MGSGLHWMRHRQRRITRVVLAFFCLVWLQVAAIPCVAAHAATTATDASHAGHAGHASPAPHDGHGRLQGGDGALADRHCVYCPPADTASSAHSCHGGDCAFPHEAQVDGRLAVLGVPPLASTGPVAMPREPQTVWLGREIACDPPPPRRSFAVAYCRFIE